MEAVLNIYKPQGMTPLQVLDAIRKRYPEYQMEKMTYAGRLDPMAEGILLVLVGDAVYRKEEYLKLDKVYEADIVLGFGTDTHDLLGMATLYDVVPIRDEEIKTAVEQMKGIFEYALPIYSSKPVQGKPLFQWAREGTVNEIEIPKRAMHVHGITLLDHYVITPEELMQIIETRIASVDGDFRQEPILGQWRSIVADMNKRTELPVVRVNVHCASGTYIRTLAHELGKRLGTGAVLMRLVRERVGDFVMAESIRL